MPAEVPVKLQVLRALTAHLEGIVGPEWGDFDLSGKVFRGIHRFGDDAPETYLSILEAPRSDSGREGGENNSNRSHDWPLLMQGWTRDDPVHPLDPVYYLEQEVSSRLSMISAIKGGSGMPRFPDVYMLGGLITSISYGPGVARPPTEGISSRVWLYMPLRLGLASVG